MTIEEIKAFAWSQNWASAPEAHILCDAIKDNHIELVVETGTCNGFTAACMALTGVTVHTFDIRDIKKIYDDEKFIDKTVKNRVVFKAIPSPECFKHVVLPAGPVLFFIDGDHSYEGCKSDFDETMKICRPGDIIYIHDIHNSSTVSQCWAEITAQFPDKTMSITSRNGLGVFKV